MESDPNSFTEPESARLLKEVTRLKEAGRFEEAIGVLNKAYHEIEREGMGHTIETYLRLPMLLQLAGRHDEAWATYNRYIAHDPSGIAPNSELAPMHRSIIYDKMRLQLQREGKAQKSVAFGVLSMLSWGQGLFLQGRHDELRAASASDVVRTGLTPLLKKAKTLHQLDALANLVSRGYAELPATDLAAIARRVGEIVFATVPPNQPGK